MIDYVVTRRFMIWRWEVFTDPPQQGMALSFTKAKAEAKAAALEAAQALAEGRTLKPKPASGMKRLLTAVGMLSLVFWAVVIYAAGRLFGFFSS